MSFIHDVGIPQTIVADNAKELNLGEWKKICQRYHIQQKSTIPYSPWTNLAESSIRELKKGITRASRRQRSPKRLWCYCGEWVAAIRRLTALNIKQLDGRTPHEHVTGSTPDISAYAMFDWYEPVWYHDPHKQFPFEKKLLGRWIGVAEVTLDLMAYYILTQSGTVVIRKSVWAVSADESNTDAYKADLASLTVAIRDKIGDSLSDLEMDPALMADFPVPPPELFDDEDEAVTEVADGEERALEFDDFTPEAYDEFITSEVLLPHGGELTLARVARRKRDADGNPIGSRSTNPILDSRLYEVEFPDGSTDAFTANIIAEHLYSQLDEEGRSFAILKEIVDHRMTDEATPKEDGFVIDAQGRQRPKITTKGWDLQVEWSDGSTSWVPLSDLKESNMLEVAEYAVASRIADEPAFAWWVRPTLRRRDRIIKKAKTRYWKRTHKYGVELPKSVKEALAIDARTKTTFWFDAIKKEMKNVMPAFEFVDGDKIPIGYKHIVCHMVFDVKHDLVRKARYVAGGHMTDPPKESTYSSVVSRDSVRIAFLIAALNDLDVLSADVQNAYLNAPTKERVYTTAGLEFGPQYVGRPVLIVRALYGLKSSGARWRDHMAATLREGGFFSCYADPDVWMRKQVRPDGFKYWEYVLCYVDDLLVISHDPKAVMDYMSSKYTLKDGSVKPPDTYLGASISKWTIHDAEDPEKPRWAMSSDAYVQRAIDDVERKLAEVEQRLVSKASTPLSADYRPELDTTPLLDDARTNYYQGLIGVLRWMCELGRIDIIVAVSMLSRYLAAPREGHLEQTLHIFAYLKAHNRSSLVFDDTFPDFDESRFTKCDWSEYYPGAEEPVPPRAPELRGRTVVMTAFVDADHAGCRVTRRSQTGIIIFLNRAPILWYSKRQNTVETSTFGSEFVAMKIGVEMIEGLRYKLRMMGIPVEGPTSVFCDNESVVTNASHPESTLKKKHNAIAYHRVREAQAADIIRVAHEPGETNLADVLTKLLAAPRLKELISRILW